MVYIVSTSPTFGKYSLEPIQTLEKEEYTVKLLPEVKNESQMCKAVKRADALIVGIEPVTKRVIENAPNLKIIAKHGVGVDNIDLVAARDHGIVVANAPGANRHAVADYVFGLMLAGLRAIPEMNEQEMRKEWKHVVGTEIHGKKLGVIGTGRIGKEVIKRAQGFSMKVLAYDVYRDPNLVENEQAQYVSLKRLFKESDVITIHTDLTKDTYKLINKEVFQQMKGTAMLINTSRGAIVDEQDLYHALSDEIIKCAALDVFESEPAHQSPLFELGNFLGTPHSAGYTEEALIEVGNITAENVIEFFRGSLPVHTINYV